MALIDIPKHFELTPWKCLIRNKMPKSSSNSFACEKTLNSKPQIRVEPKAHPQLVIKEHDILVIQHKIVHCHLAHSDFRSEVALTHRSASAFLTFMAARDWERKLRFRRSLEQLGWRYVISHSLSRSAKSA